MFVQRRLLPFRKSAVALYSLYPSFFAFVFCPPPASDSRLRIFYSCILKAGTDRVLRHGSACFSEVHGFKSEPVRVRFPSLLIAMLRSNMAMPCMAVLSCCVIRIIQTATSEKKNTKNEKKVLGFVGIMTVNNGEMGVFLWQFI